MYLDNYFQIFFEDLASNKPSPGGGSVAALTGVQAVCLVLMVSRLTLGKKNYDDVQGEVEEIIEKALSVKDTLMLKVEDDIHVFQDIMRCYTLPKDQKKESLKEALKKSAYFSFSMVEDALEILKLANRIGKIGNKNLISDVAIAVSLAIATIESSVINVRINLKSLKDEKISTELESKIEDRFEQAKQYKKETLEIIGIYI